MYYCGEPEEPFIRRSLRAPREEEISDVYARHIECSPYRDDEVLQCRCIAHLWMSSCTRLQGELAHAADASIRRRQGEDAAFF